MHLNAPKFLQNSFGLNKERCQVFPVLIQVTRGLGSGGVQQVGGKNTFFHYKKDNVGAGYRPRSIHCIKISADDSSPVMGVLRLRQ